LDCKEIRRITRKEIVHAHRSNHRSSLGPGLVWWLFSTYVLPRVPEPFRTVIIVVLVVAVCLWLLSLVWHPWDRSTGTYAIRRRSYILRLCARIVCMYGELPDTTFNGTTTRGLLVSIQNPPKSALLRLPTNDELLVYMQAQRSLFRDLGNRKTETESVQTPKADQALFRAVRLDQPTDDSLEFDDAEALKAINDLLFHRLESCDRDGEHYILVLRTPSRRRHPHRLYPIRT